MDMHIGPVLGATEINAAAAGESIPLVSYEAEERQLDCFVRDGSGAAMRPFLTTVTRVATGEVVASQLSPGPLNRELLNELAFAYGGVFLPLGEPGRWAIALPQTCEVI